MEKNVLKVEGMSCDHCVHAVRQAVSGVPGTAEVSVDLKKGTVSFLSDPAQTALKDIKAAIIDAGYELPVS